MRAITFEESCVQQLCTMQHLVLLSAPQLLYALDLNVLFLGKVFLRLKCTLPASASTCNAELAVSAKRFSNDIFADICSACIGGDSAARVAALPALALVATTWPNQPVALRHSQPVAAVDEALLVTCNAASDLDHMVRSPSGCQPGLQQSMPSCLAHAWVKVLASMPLASGVTSLH